MKHFLAIFGLVGSLMISSIVQPTTKTEAEVFKIPHHVSAPVEVEPKLVLTEFDGNFLSMQRTKESTGKHRNPDGTLTESPKGALGISQFMPTTWNWLKEKGYLPSHFDINDADHQKKAQAIYMEYLYNYDYKGKGLNQRSLAIAAYNCGPGRVRREVKKHNKNWKHHIPDETKDYLLKLDVQ